MGVKLIASGGGSVEMVPAATASNFTATVPAATGTVVLTGVNGTVNINAAGANNLTFSTNSSERARIDASGNLLVGATTVLGKFTLRWPSATQQGIAMQATDVSFSGSPVLFLNSVGGTSGFIGQTTSTVSYNTSSDYRLKEQVQPMTGALTKIASFKPVTYKWKVDGADGEGFIAHELAEVCPQAVSGEKDAVDTEGNPKYQGIDTSFLVATLTAAIQELKAIVDAQGAEIAALKGTQP
jgi:hypothetical protein